MRFSLLVLVAACHRPSAPPAPVGNSVAPGVAVTIGREEPLGYLGLGLALPGQEGESWIPESTQFGAFTLTDDPLPAKVTVIGRSGPAQLLAVAPSVALKYGCDDNTLGVHPLLGPRVPPGAAWVLPPTAPATWSPTALELRSTHADPARHSYVAGILSFEVTRVTDATGQLQILRDGQLVHDALFERPDMDGYAAPPLDVSESSPGVPEPIAAWAIAPAGPFLVVILRPSMEGVTLQPMLVEARGTRVLEDMSIYLYRCAF